MPATIKNTILWLVIVILIAMLVFLSYLISNQQKLNAKEKESPPITIKKIEPTLLSWQLATATAAWQPRDSAASFIFQNKLWTMGGINGNQDIQENHRINYWEAPHFNDIWNTNDGVNWQLVKTEAEWPLRRSMSVIEFQGKLWMLGGWSPTAGYINDIWQSDDGMIWKKAADRAPWPTREGQTVEIFQDKLWLIGGVNYDERQTKNDVWWSADGLNWQQATSTIPWSGRWDHATVIFDDKIFLIGGMNLTGDVFSDIWSTADGVNWELITNQPEWPARQGHDLAVFKNYLWLIGRLNDDEQKGANDIWYSKDGIKWQKTFSDPPWTGREDHSVIIFNDKIYVFGGMDADWRWRNDVWMTNN